MSGRRGWHEPETAGAGVPVEGMRPFSPLVLCSLFSPASVCTTKSERLGVCVRPPLQGLETLGVPGPLPALH